MLRLGWFSTGRGEGSLGLLTCVADAIARGELAAELAFVFCNRAPGEHPGSDAFCALAMALGAPVERLSSQLFRRERGAASFAAVRDAYDDAVLAQLSPYERDVHALAGYGLIFGGAMARSRPALNLHPAAPDGPVGTWQQVIWALIEARAAESGVLVHLATEALDRGPLASYVTFPVRGPGFDPQWGEAGAATVAELQASHGESLPLFQAIRQAGLARERPLLLETLKAVADGRLRVDGDVVADGDGRAAAPLCLTDEVERAVADGSCPPPQPTA